MNNQNFFTLEQNKIYAQLENTMNKKESKKRNFKLPQIDKNQVKVRLPLYFIAILCAVAFFTFLVIHIYSMVYINLYYFASTIVIMKVLFFISIPAFISLIYIAIDSYNSECIWLSK